MYARVFKFYIWICYERIADTSFSPQDYAPIMSYGPLKKWMISCQQNISKAIKARALKVEEWIGSDE